jgi:phage-related tail protein
MENEYWAQLYQREMEEKNDMIQAQRNEIQRLHSAIQEVSYNFGMQRSILTHEIESKVEKAAGANSFIRVEAVKAILRDVSSGLVDSTGVRIQTRTCQGGKRCRDEENDGVSLELPDGLRVA